MVFKIADGREHFYQWDINRQVLVSDPTLDEVHFSNKAEELALVVAVKDGIAEVPNILLQQGFTLRVYAVEGDITLYEEYFEVIARPKPSNYVYTETEVKSYEYLEKKLNEIEEKGFSEETVVDAIENWLEENPINLDGYATEDYVDNAISNIDTSDIDLSGYALKTDIPDVSEFIKEIPSEYITETELEAKKYLTEHQSLEEYAKKSELFSKDYNDLTNKPTIPSIEGLATETYVNNAVAGIPKVDLSEYAKKEDIPDVSDFISEIPEEYITETELEAKKYLTEHQSLEHLALKEHEHEEYLTEHQSLENYYTKTEVDEAIENIEVSSGGIPTYTIQLSSFNTTYTNITPEDKLIIDAIYNGTKKLNRDLKLYVQFVDTSGKQCYEVFSWEDNLINGASVALYCFNPSSPLKVAMLSFWKSNENSTDWYYRKDVSYTYSLVRLDDIYTKTQIDRKLEALEARIAALEGGNN